MTSNADTLVNTPSAPAGIHHHNPRSSSPPTVQPTQPSTLEAPWKPDHASAPVTQQNGHDDQDAEGESEAETVVLSRD